MRGMRDESNAARERVAWREVGRWLAPWLLGLLLMAVALLGLLAASRAEDDGAYAMGFITAGLALLALGWQVKSAFDAPTATGVPPLLVEDGASLVVLVALLAVLAVAGLLLAARSGEATLEAAGYALFGSGLIFIFWNLKHYFDWHERHPPG
jgi:hypothetical protein